MPSDSELIKALKNINIESLTEDDKDELLKFFVVTNRNDVRNHLAFIFSDSRYNKAVPYIIDKINDKDLAQFSGSLVYACDNLDVKDYFVDLVKVICEREYESRYQAYEIVIRLAPDISDEIIDSALALLEERREVLDELEPDSGVDSPLHFVEQTIKLIRRNHKA